ncbi:cysteine hydrolase family protein [Agromyces sp. Marseille-P2726]|uniref:cysteine hydrolase family protein n=1 Tax=Agromyces sp. Marseille-P2726 TaxID=2709132 RepID=UPI00156D4CD0|nr:isochorismatase family cysteine hydrolase [Agromyces sp. Marseille-P2726]
MAERPYRYDPAHAALVVVDVQNDFCHPEGSVATMGSDVSAAVEMVPRLRSLIDQAHSVGVPVVFVQTLHDDTNDTAMWLGRVTAEPGGVQTGRICRTGSWGAEFYGVTPGSDDTVVTKHRFSAFVGTNLDIVLKTLSVRSLLVTGVATEVCVESTLRDGLSAEYFVSLVEDCAATYTAEAHESSVRNVRRNFGTVVTSDELVGIWAGITPVGSAVSSSSVPRRA